MMFNATLQPIYACDTVFDTWNAYSLLASMVIDEQLSDSDVVL